MNKTTCSICFDEPTRPTVTPCGHIFCYECINDWLQRQSSCPICKSRLLPSDLVQLAESSQQPRNDFRSNYSRASDRQIIITKCVLPLLLPVIIMIVLFVIMKITYS